MFKIVSKLAPLGSKRRIILKLLRNTLKNPRVYFNKLNKSNLKKLKNQLNSRDIEMLEAKINDFDEKVKNVKGIEIVVFEEKENYEKIIFDKVENPKVSIIIPVYNQWSYTYNCLKSIKENTEDITYEIIIADDISNDMTKDIKDYIENIKVIRNETNLGFLKNCNNAVKYASGEYIHFLNNDTNVQKDWLSSLVELIESNKKIGLVGSKLVYSDGTLQEAGGIIWNDGSGWNYGRMDDPEKSEYNYVREVDYISGASIMISKKLWEEIGGFDERYTPAYCEDSDLAFEVRKKGYKVMYQPFSCVVHFEGKSHGVDENSGIKHYQVLNKEKLMLKWEKEFKEQFPNAEDVFIARDRSKNKKTILVVDHYIPTFDKDAGSRTVYQYLKLFVELGYNVKFIGDNFYRDEKYIKYLQKIGIEVLYGNWYFKNWKKWILMNKRYIDICFLNRPHISEKYIDYLKENTNAKIIYYGHDLHFLREKREYELLKDEKILKSSEEIKKVELDIISKVDLSYYPSQLEINELKEINKNYNAKVLPPYMFEFKYEMKKFEGESRNNLLFVGGFNHKPNYDAMIWFLDEIFPKILDKNSKIKILIAGSNIPKEVLEKANENIVIKGFVTDEELDILYKECKIAVVPLRYGAGIKGKVVEAFYNGLPVITTDIGIEGIKNSENIVILANNSIEFVEKIIKFYDDNTYLENLSFNAQKYINENFTKEFAKKVIIEDFN